MKKQKKQGRKAVHVDWKSRYKRFGTKVTMFRLPYQGRDITSVDQDDTVPYTRHSSHRCTSSKTPPVGVYLEVEVLANPDHVSLAVVDSEGRGFSVTLAQKSGPSSRKEWSHGSREVSKDLIQPPP